MKAYSDLTGRDEHVYREQLLEYVPALDRIYLKDFYDKQAKEIEKARKKAEASTRPRR